METRITWDPAKARHNERVHGISFETAVEAFADPNQVVRENYFVEDDGEQRYGLIGMTRSLVLLLAVLWIAARRRSRSCTSSRQERQNAMRKTSTPRTSRIKISEETRRAYEERDRRLDNDPEVPTMPPEFWASATIGRFYRPLKTQISLRIDADVLEWLRSKGEGHLTRINEILRERMLAERRP
jgi:uncharacterized protein (DUF4415 family)